MRSCAALRCPGSNWFWLGLMMVSKASEASFKEAIAEVADEICAGAPPPVEECLMGSVVFPHTVACERGRCSPSYE